MGESADLPFGWTVVRHDHVQEGKDRKKVTYRWAVIICGKHKVYRVLRFGGHIPRAEIVIDWPGWMDLQGRPEVLEETVRLRIRTPRFWEYLIMPFKHVDPGYRLSAWLGAISIALGLLSVGLAFLI